MRDGWVETTLGEVATVFSGFPFNSESFNESTGMPLIRIRDLPNRMMTEVLYSGPFDETYLVSRGDFLVGMDGEFRCYEWLGVPALLNQRVCRIQDFKTSRVVPRLIYFALNKFLSDIESNTGYTTVKHISTKQIKGIQICLPPLVEQRRIVDVIQSVDNYIAALQDRVDAARIARNAVLHELLNAGGDGWVETTLGDVAEWFSGGTPKAGKPEFYDNGSIPWVVISDMLNKEIYETATQITSSALKEIGGRLAPINSVLISMYATVGRPAIARIPVATNQAIAWSVPNTELVVPDFLLMVAESLEQEISSMARGATQRNINRAMLREFVFQLPPLVEQRRIVEIVSSMDDSIQATEQAVIEAKNLRSGLLSDLLSGEHEIPESYDKLLGAA
jgi:type I restriction enzyme S subunit